MLWKTTLRVVVGVAAVLLLATPQHEEPISNVIQASFPITHSRILLPAYKIDPHAERDSVQPVDIPFLQTEEEWEMAGKGISLGATGEPKSGTTWLARVIVELSVKLCGSATNTWCKMGGLKVTPHQPAPRYDFEMLHAKDQSLYLHFRGRPKHTIPGFELAECNRKGRAHKNRFELNPPCIQSEPLTRQRLLVCLPDPSPRCVRELPPLDTDIRRMIVIVRDPRNVVISEHRMRSEMYRHRPHELDTFIHERFETIVAWMHQRWVWHTTALAAISYVAFYEDLKADHQGLVDLAAFMGLKCSLAQAKEIWKSHKYSSPPGGYNTYGLPLETLEWMNVTMSFLLPEPMLNRWGLLRTNSHASV